MACQVKYKCNHFLYFFAHLKLRTTCLCGDERGKVVEQTRVNTPIIYTQSFIILPSK